MGRNSALQMYVTKVACAIWIVAGYKLWSFGMSLLLVIHGGSGASTEARQELSCSKMG